MHPTPFNEAEWLDGLSAGSVAYLIVGIACLICGLIGAFGSLFSSIPAAMVLAGLVAAPIFIGLVGFKTPHRIFPAFEALGCSVMLFGLTWIYIGDWRSGTPTTAFSHHGVWLLVWLLNLAQLIFSINRLR